MQNGEGTFPKSSNTLEIPLNPMAIFTGLSLDFEGTEKTNADFPSSLHEFILGHMTYLSEIGDSECISRLLFELSYTMKNIIRLVWQCKQVIL